MRYDRQAEGQRGPPVAAFELVGHLSFCVIDIFRDILCAKYQDQQFHHPAIEHKQGIQPLIQNHHLLYLPGSQKALLP